MKKKTKYNLSEQLSSRYFSLVVALAFGLILNLIPASSASSENLPVCQGTASSKTVVRLGGRVVTPANLLLSANGQSCGRGENSLSLVSLSHTRVVTPTGTPQENGAVLLSEMAYISNAGASSSNPWLLKLEPGSYDLGNNVLTLLPYVDLEGSGEDITLISSSLGTFSYPPTTGTLVAASYSEVRNLTVTNLGSSSFQIAVNVPSSVTNARFVHLTTNVGGATGTGNMGLFNNSTNLYVEDSNLAASGTSADNQAFNNNAGRATIKGSSIMAQGAANFNNTGLYIHGGVVGVSNSSLGAIGGAGSNNTGLFNLGIVTVTNSTISASGGSSSYGFINSGGTAYAGASQLSGGTGVSNGLNRCPASYNGFFVPLDPVLCK